MTIYNSVKIYISASPDLMAEREALARMIAELPVTLPWLIGQTPAEAEPVDTEALLSADLYFLVMGADIRAPVGLELHFAQQGNRRVTAFLKQGAAFTPAGQVFARQAQVDWQPFSKAADLRIRVQRHIIDHLLRRAVEYALSPVEIAQLENLLVTDRPDKDKSAQGEGAGHSAVLLSRDRYLPSEGVLIDDDT